MFTLSLEPRVHTTAQGIILASVEASRKASSEVSWEGSCINCIFMSWILSAWLRDCCPEIYPWQRASRHRDQDTWLFSHLWHYPVTQPSLGLGFMTCQIKGQHDQFLGLSSHFGIIGLYACHEPRVALIHTGSMTLPPAVCTEQKSEPYATEMELQGWAFQYYHWGTVLGADWGLPGPRKPSPQVALDLHIAKVLSLSPWVPVGPPHRAWDPGINLGGLWAHCWLTI